MLWDDERIDRYAAPLQFILNGFGPLPGLLTERGIAINADIQRKHRSHVGVESEKGFVRQEREAR